MNLLPKTVELEILANPTNRIIHSCEQAKAWLERTANQNKIQEIVELKARAEGICAYTKKQKQISETARLSAAEIVRRAERCIGLAVRRGQAEGRVVKRGDIGHGRKVDSAKVHDLLRPSSVVGHFRERTQTYAMTDNVSDKQFEAGLKKARAERNLSRANVVRKVKGKGNGKPDQWANLADLAAAGSTSHQIAKAFGVHRETVVRNAARRGIVIRADRVMRGTRVHKPDRILRELVDNLDSLAPSCELIEISSIPDSVIQECIPIMGDALKTFGKFQRRLRRALSG